MDKQTYRDALAAIAPGPLGYEDWMKVGFAAKAAGLELDDFMAWSRNSPKHDERYTVGQWQGWKADGGITAGTLIALAKEAGWKPGKTPNLLRKANPPMARVDEKLPPLAAQVIDGPVTVADLADMPRWAPVVNKKLHYRWRHSRRECVALARYGGVEVEDEFGGRKVKTLLLPWTTRAGAERYGYPTFILSGDAHCPSNDIMALDCDYKPAADPDGEGERYRDALRLRCFLLAMPVVPSSSGNGFHALARLEPDGFDVGLPSTIPGWKPYLAEDGKTGLYGVAIDLFLPGAKRHIVLQWEKILDLDQTLPVLAAGDLNGLLTG